MARAPQTADTPLMDLVRERGAQFESINGRTVAVSYGDVLAECAALRDGAGVIDLSHTTRVLHTGRDALDLLNRLTTNDLGGLGVGEVATTVLTSEIGRVIDLFQVVRLGSDQLLLTSDSFDPEPMIENIDKYTILEDAVLEGALMDGTRLPDRLPETLQMAGGG